MGRKAEAREAFLRTGSEANHEGDRPLHTPYVRAGFALLMFTGELLVPANPRTGSATFKLGLSRTSELCLRVPAC